MQNSVLTLQEFLLICFSHTGLLPDLAQVRDPKIGKVIGNHAAAAQQHALEPEAVGAQLADGWGAKQRKLMHCRLTNHTVRMNEKCLFI